MGTTLTLRAPAGYELARDVCSYGYFLLAPNHWDVGSQTLRRTLNLPAGAATAVVSNGTAGALRARFDRGLDRAEQAAAREQLARCLGLDVSDERVAEFHAVDPRWRRSGRGRLFRSPTLFEDVVKTVTSCNVAWPSTITMNRRLCEVLGPRSPGGHHAFPAAAKLARTRPGTLRSRCTVGYRDTRIVGLAKLFATPPARGGIDEAWLTDPATPDDEAYAFLRSLPGIGPYAAGNIMQLLGRCSRLALDTESVRHGRSVLGLEGDDRAVLKEMERRYDAFGAHKFRSYWFELWADYESRRGPAHLWDRETTGKTFTAAQLKDGVAKKKRAEKKAGARAAGS